MSDDVIARKLIADGNGLNEDRRLINLFTFINSLETNPSDQATLANIENILQQAEFSFNKQLAVADMCIKGSDQIREFMTEVGMIFLYFIYNHFLENDISKLRDRIEHVKTELAEAKLVRKNKQEYDALAKLILAKSSRPESAAQLEKIELEINELHERKKELEDKLAEKRKNTYALAVLLSDLEATNIEGTQFSHLNYIAFQNNISRLT
jgi:THO complex subunit 7